MFTILGSMDVAPCMASPHRLNMEVDLQSLFGLHVTWCEQLYSLADPALGLVYEGAIGQQR